MPRRFPQHALYLISDASVSLSSRSGACRLFSNFNKFVSAASLSRFQASVSNRFHVDLNCTNSVIVTRDYEINAIRVAVGIYNTDNGDTQLVGFFNGNTLVINVDNEQRVRQTAHVFDTTDRALKLIHFTGALKGFFLGQLVESTVFALGFQFTVATD